MNEPQNRRVRTQLVLTGRCTPSRDLSAEHQDRITACHGRDIKRGCSRLLAIAAVSYNGKMDAEKFELTASGFYRLTNNIDATSTSHFPMLLSFDPPI